MDSMDNGVEWRSTLRDPVSEHLFGMAAHKAKQLPRKAAIIVRPLGDQRGTTYGCISSARPAAKKGHREDCIGGHTSDLHVITHDSSVDLKP